MAITATAQGKKFTFPEGTTQEQMADAIDQYFSGQATQSQGQVELTQDEDLGSAVAASIGRGFTKIPRGIEGLFNFVTGSDTDLLTRSLGLPSSEDEKRLFKPLEEEFPIATTGGEILGEVAGTLPFGMGAAAGARGLTTAGTKAARFAPALAAGVTEGAIIGAADEQAIKGAAIGGAAAVAAEALLPPIAKRLRRFFGKAKPIDEIVTISGGKISPTKETQEILDEIGLSFDDIAKQAQDEVLTPQQTATRAAFREEGIEPATRTRIRPNVKDIQREGFLLRQTDSEAADKLRERVLNENEAIKTRFSQIADDLGVTGEEGGDKLKSALFGIQSNMRSARNQAYQDLADVAKERPDLINRIPLNQDRLIEGVSEASRFPLDQQTENAIVRVFEDFGLREKTAGPSGLRLLTGESDVTPLTLSNLSEFRSQISNVFDNAKASDRGARKSIINAIDDIELEIVEAFEDTSLKTPKLIQDAAKRARQSVIEEKRTFETGDLINQLIKPKRAGMNAKESPLVAGSKVYGKISQKATPVEDTRKLVNTLLEDGSDESLEALGNLQASVMMDLLDSSVVQSRRLTNEAGQSATVFSGTRLNNRIKAIGEDKIKEIFKNNKEALDSLKRLRKISESIITPDEAIQKGSIPPDTLNKALNAITRAKAVPVVGEPVSAAVGGIQAAAKGKQLQRFGPTEDDLIDFVIFEGSPRLEKILNATGRFGGEIIKESAAPVAADIGTE